MSRGDNVSAELTSTLCSVLDNWSWWRDVEAVEFASDVARYFRVSSMLAKER